MTQERNSLWMAVKDFLNCQGQNDYPYLQFFKERSNNLTSNICHFDGAVKG